MAIAGVVAVVVTVHLTAARILLGADVTLLPDAIGIGELTTPALSDVKHIVIHIDSEEVIDTDSTAEELYSVIRTHIGKDIGDLRAATDTIEGERVVLHSVVTLSTAVLQLEIGDGAGVVCGVITTIGVLGVDLRLGALLAGGEGSVAIDDQSAPGAGLLVLSGEGDGTLCRTLDIDLGTLLHEDVLIKSCLRRDDRTGRDGEGGALLDEESSIEGVSDLSVESAISGDIPLEGGLLLLHLGLLVVILLAGGGKAERSDPHHEEGDASSKCFHCLFLFENE